MPIIEKCGRSGVELHEIRRHVDAEGNDTSSRGKPKNNYTDNRIIVPRGTKGFNANRPRSCGFGPSKIHYNEKVPKLSKTQQAMLIAIDGGTQIRDKLIKAAKELEKMDLIMFSERDGIWKAMADGRRIAGLLQEK